MATFTLPKNSVISKKGKHHRADGATRIKKFTVYRYDPVYGVYVPVVEQVWVPDPVVYGPGVSLNFGYYRPWYWRGGYRHFEHERHEHHEHHHH